MAITFLGNQPNIKIKILWHFEILTWEHGPYEIPKSEISGERLENGVKQTKILDSGCNEVYVQGYFSCQID